MNELYTPPGYVEYPRDPKFRPLPEPDRLLVMARAYDRFYWFWCMLPANALGLSHRHSSTFTSAPSAVLILAVSICVWLRIRDIFRAKGWPVQWSVSIAIALGALGLLATANRWGSWLWGLGFVCTYLAIFGATRVIVYREFRKFDRDLPFTFGSRRLGRIIGAMMANAESKGSPIAPQG